jgi:hypothetical protein
MPGDRRVRLRRSRARPTFGRRKAAVGGLRQCSRRTIPTGSIDRGRTGGGLVIRGPQRMIAPRRCGAASPARAAARLAMIGKATEAQRHRGFVDACSQGSRSRPGTCSRSPEVRDPPLAGAGCLSGVGRLGCRRTLVVGLRPRGGLQGARGASALRPLSRDRDRGDGVHHLARVQPDHRAFPDRWRRLSGRDVADRSVRRPDRRCGADRRLRADDRDLDRERNRRDVQPAAAVVAAVQALRRTPALGPADLPQPARDERVDQDPAADLHRVRRDPLHPDRVRHPHALERPAEPVARHVRGDRQARG